tara:strand:- start:752 stop:1168 length:417 start_codon:yes stop_codon:yes gene_type:complete
MQKIDIVTKNSQETYNLGLKISNELKEGNIIGLIGDLASGKTTFVKGVLKGLDYEYEVTSPTFTLINEYKAKIKVIHIDFYREKNIDRWNDLGFQELINNNAIIIIEWADLLLDLLPNNICKIYFDHLQLTQRRIYSK